MKVAEDVEKQQTAWAVVMKPIGTGVALCQVYCLWCGAVRCGALCQVHWGGWCGMVWWRSYIFPLCCTSPGGGHPRNEQHAKTVRYLQVSSDAEKQ